MKKQTGFAFIELILVVVVVGLLGAISYQLYNTYYNNPSRNLNAKTGGGSLLSKLSNDNQKQYTPLSSGLDDQSLNSDLGNINTGISQGEQNVNSSGSAVNDQQNQISIPTN